MPANLNITATNSRVMLIRWTALQDEQWNGNRVGFRIEITELESGRVRHLTIHNSAATSTIVSSLHPYYTYRCRIAAYNIIGTGPYASMSITMPQDGKQRCFTK